MPISFFRSLPPFASFRDGSTRESRLADELLPLRGDTICGVQCLTENRSHTSQGAKVVSSYFFPLDTVTEATSQRVAYSDGRLFWCPWRFYLHRHGGKMPPNARYVLIPSLGLPVQISETGRHYGFGASVRVYVTLARASPACLSTSLRETQSE